ncbi:MAG: hypothetical protein ABSF35_04360 [Polyangia bacterium]
MNLPVVEVQGVQVACGRFEIELPGGRRLRVPAGFDAERLRRFPKRGAARAPKALAASVFRQVMLGQRT